MTELQTRIVEFLKANNLYATKGTYAILPNLVEEAIYTAEALGVAYFLAHTCFGPKLKQFVIGEVTERIMP